MARFSRRTTSIRSIMIGAIAVAAILFSAPTNAHAYSRSAKASGWKATVTFAKVGGSGQWAEFSKMRVTIKRGRRVIVKRRKLVAGPGFQPKSWVKSFGRPKLRTANLDNDPAPEFFVEWSYGCTHTCTVYNFFGVGAPRAAAVPAGPNNGYEVADLDGDGVAEIKGTDLRFSYMFASYASSVPPVQIMSLRSGTMVDVTRSHPTAIQQDADRLLGLWNSGFSNSEGGNVALSYAANLCLLGRATEAFEFLENAENSVEVPLPDQLENGYSSTYAEEASTFLIQLGYC